MGMTSTVDGIIVTSRTFLLAERSDAKNCIIVMTR